MKMRLLSVHYSIQVLAARRFLPAIALVLLACLALLPGRATAAVFDDFESYAVGSNLHGQGGWAGWAGDAKAGALVSSNFAFSPTRSVNIAGASDLARTFSGATNGQWVFRVMQYIPSTSTGTTYVILLNTYRSPYGAADLNWSVQIQNNMATGQIISDYGGGATLPMVKDAWVEVRCEINLASNSVSEFYNGQLLSTHAWQDGTGLNEIQALDLFANNAAPVYYDNVSLTVSVHTDCVQMTCATNKTVQCGSAWGFDAPTNIIDHCCASANYTLSFSTVTNGACPQFITRTWLISDICGNSNTCSQTVTVVDTTPLALICATNKTVACGTDWTFDPPAVKAACCGTFTFSTVTNGTSPLVITRTWRVTDCCSNSITCSQTVTVMTNCCVTLSNECVFCSTNGSYTYSFDLRNDSGQTAYSLLLAEVAGNPVFTTPLITLTPPLPTGQTRHLSVTITSTDCGGPLCFYIVPHTQTFEDCCSLLHCITLPICCPPRTYTLDADFDEGFSVNLNHTNVHDQLQVNAQTSPFPYVWIAASLRGTVVKIDSSTGRILGEYLSAPNGRFRNPSRTTVDKYGNCWIGNRDESVGSKGSVTRYAIIIGGTRGDKIPTGGGGFTFSPSLNGQYLKPPFIYNSGAVDRDGDGLIKTSRGSGDILSWSNGGSADGNGGVSTAEDEAIITYVRTAGTGARSLAVDTNNDLWVGGKDNRAHEKYSGLTGTNHTGDPLLNPTAIPGTLFNMGIGGYGAVIGGNGIVWSSQGPNTGGGLLRLNPTLLTGLNLGVAAGNYGLSIDACSGFVWHTSFLDGTTASNGTIGRVYVRNGAGTVVAAYGHGKASAQGVCVDQSGNVFVAHCIYETGTPSTVGRLLAANGCFVGNIPLTWGSTNGRGATGVAMDDHGKIWVSCYYSNLVMRIDPLAGPSTSCGVPLGAVDLAVDLNAFAYTPPPAQNINAGPYNYSDQTGFVILGITSPGGWWTVVREGCMDGIDWGTVSWHSVEPAGTGIKVEVRADNDVLALPSKPWTQVSSGKSFCGSGITGRYLEIRAFLSKASACTESPALLDLTVRCCRPLSPLSVTCIGPPRVDWTLPIKICDPAPFTTNLSAVIVHPGGLPMQVSFSVNGANILTTNIAAGPPPTRAVVDFVHTYQPGSNNVELVITDLVNDPVIVPATVIVGDRLPPEWRTTPSLATNAFTGVVPLFQPVLVDDCAGPGEIVVTQDRRPGTVVGQGTFLVTLVASDPSGNRSTNITAFTVDPVLSITSPQPYDFFLTTTSAPVTVQIASNVTDVARVNYYLDSNLVATATSAPFGVNLTNVPAGDYALTAEAVNPNGLTSRSQPVLVSFGTSEPVRIGFTRTASGFILTWPAGWTLQSASSILGPWSDVPGATSPYPVIADSARRFFRLRQ